ncbi:hypothetical protein J6590_081694 [Homalodisca vitripennis]|nr:hypothetical protein J6590_081694 [Homalodisca vitripennis]
MEHRLTTVLLCVKHSTEDSLISGLVEIFFTARHECSGFYIKKNGDNVAQCMTTSHTSGSDVKRNTCFTAAIIHLHEHDKLSIREVDGSRFRDTSFKDSHSFFGLIQLKST